MTPQTYTLRREKKCNLEPFLKVYVFRTLRKKGSQKGSLQSFKNLKSSVYNQQWF